MGMLGTTVKIFYKCSCALKNSWKVLLRWWVLLDLFILLTVLPTNWVTDPKCSVCCFIRIRGLCCYSLDNVGQTHFIKWAGVRLGTLRERSEVVTHISSVITLVLFTNKGIAHDQMKSFYKPKLVKPGNIRITLQKSNFPSHVFCCFSLIWDSIESNLFPTLAESNNFLKI